MSAGSTGHRHSPSPWAKTHRRSRGRSRTPGGRSSVEHGLHTTNERTRSGEEQRSHWPGTDRHTKVLQVSIFLKRHIRAFDFWGIRGKKVQTGLKNMPLSPTSHWEVEEVLVWKGVHFSFPAGWQCQGQGRADTCENWAQRHRHEQANAGGESLPPDPGGARNGNLLAKASQPRV